MKKVTKKNILFTMKKTIKIVKGNSVFSTILLFQETMNCSLSQEGCWKDIPTESQI